MNTFILRDYQVSAVESVFSQWQAVTATLVVMPTGCGKTVVFAEIIRRLQPLRTLVLAHREELIFQAREKIEQIAQVECDIEMADETASFDEWYRRPVVLATVQTMISGRGKRRYERFNPMDFGLIIVDEAHHIPADSYKAILDWFKRNPSIKILGVTATPDRADEEALGQILETVAFDYEITDAINDAWLVPVKQQFVHIEGLDFSAIRTTAGDLNGGDLARVMEAEKNLHGLCGSAIDIIGERQTILFTVTVRHAEMACNILNRHLPNSAEWVCGKTPKEDRRRIMKRFGDGSLQILCNVGVACLDSETEILTRRGWVRYDSISMSDKIASWDTCNKIRFSEPLGIEVRQRRDNERMVSLNTKNRSIRVTEDHRMVFCNIGSNSYSVVRAGKLVNNKCELPISGFSEPENISVDQDAILPDGRRIAANSYKLRKTGMSASEAKTEAIRRITARNALRVLSPHELSANECQWIGFWCGDGSRCNLQSGGIEYTVSGSDQWPHIATWFENLSKACGFHFIKRRILPTKLNRQPTTRWSFCRGTGFGPQRVTGGLFGIERYLDKNGSDLIWCLSPDQYDNFIYGLWMADGNHKQGKIMPSGIRIYSSNERFLNHVQAVCVCRGYRANLVWKPNGQHRIGVLALSKRKRHIATKFRLQFEAIHFPEIVWCVKSITGFIVTRRNGTVTITGNTEGFDIPTASVILMGKPTKSRALYAQCAGRAFRPLPRVVDGLATAEERRAAIAASAKPSALLVDYVGNSGRHKLMSSADILGGKYSDQTVELALRALRKDGKPRDIREALDEASVALRMEAEKRRKMMEEAQKSRLVAKVKFSLSEISPFDAFGITPKTTRPFDSGRLLSEPQRNVLLKQGIDPDSMPYAAAAQLIQEQFRRWKEGLCTFKMARLLTKRGINASNMKMEEAKAMIDRIAAKEGWRK